MFSVGFSAFNLTEIDNDAICNEILLNKDVNLNSKVIQGLNSIVIKNSQQILNGIISNPEITNTKIDLKRAWGNHNMDPAICIPHVHRDSLLSAVYYPKANDTTINFHSPWTDYMLSHLPIDVLTPSTDFNEFNSSFYSLPVQTGMLVIFFSHILHSVPYTNKERFSLAYDIGVKNVNI